jgi:adenine-specific DNA-methyltransferase
MIIPDARLKFFRRVKSVRTSTGDDIDAGRIIRAILHLWQARKFPELRPARAPWGTAAYVADPAVEELADWVSRQPFGDAAYWIATAYSLLVDKDTRSERALFFTPPILADRLISNLLSAGADLVKNTWHDPACGGSAFLVPLALRMMKGLDGTKLTAKQKLITIENALSGNDIDAELLHLSAALLEMATFPLIKESRYSPEFNLTIGDGLLAAGSGTYDAVICNPPYRKLKAGEVDAYREAHGDVIEGQPNIYGLFINRSLTLAKRDGLIGLLTPTSFLSGDSFSKLRAKLLKDACVLSVDMLGNRKSMFIDVLQETAITLLKPTEAIRDNTNAKTQIVVLTDDGKYRDVGKFPLPNSGSPWPIPRSEDDAALVAAAERGQFTLTDYGYVPRIGSLVAYRDKRPRFAKRPVDVKDRLIVPLVWATDIAPNGAFDHGRQHRSRKSRPFVQIKGLNEAGVVKVRSVLLQRLTSSDQRSRLVAAPISPEWLKKNLAYVCENHVIVLEPSKQAAVSIELMAELLNTKAVDRVFRTISSATNVAVSELNALLLPAPAAWVAAVEKTTDFEAAARVAYEGTAALAKGGVKP